MIIFTKGIYADKLRDAFNNDIIEFHSDDDATPAKCEITATGLAVTLYPAPDGSFFFNFKDYITALINTRYFADTLNPDIETDYLYDFTSGSYLELDVDITITFTDDTTDESVYSLAWLASVQQIGEFIPLQKTETYILSPYASTGTNQYYLKYWEGYPFDISFYYPGETLYLKNTNTSLQESFDIPGLVTRLVVSDGRTDVTLEDIMPIVNGLNYIRVKSEAEDNIKDKFLSLIKEPYKCGVYVKWINSMGGYNYWLFENTAAIDRSVKYSEEISNEFENLETAYTRTLQTGKSSQDVVRVVAELLSDEDNRILQGILDSPKIYLFTGEPMSQNGVDSWVEVTLKTNSARIKQSKTKMNNYLVEFELPQRYTQNL